jgi:putative transposase
VKYAWIRRHDGRWPISLQCEVLGVSASGYFDHIGEQASSKAGKRLSDEAVLVHIKAAYAASKGEYLNAAVTAAAIRPSECRH